MTTLPHDEVMTALAEATARLVRTVDGLDAAALSGPSRLAGWTRAHVVAHLALNAEALAGVLDGAAAGRPVPMYPDPAARDDAIAELADLSGATAVADLRARSLAATTTFADAAARLRPADWEGVGSRTPGGPSFTLVTVPAMRLIEVEVHHVDLDAGYGHADWPADFAERLLDLRVPRQDWATPVRLLARDLARTWEHAADDSVAAQPVAVTADVRDLAWWLSGRGDGADLTVDGGGLPTPAPW